MEPVVVEAELAEGDERGAPGPGRSAAVLYQGSEVGDDDRGLGGVDGLPVGYERVRVWAARGRVLGVRVVVVRARVRGVKNGGGARVYSCGGVDGPGWRACELRELMHACLPGRGGWKGGMVRIRLTVLIGYCEGVPRALEAGPGHDELGTPNLPGSVDDAGKVVVMTLFAVVHAPENRVSEVDSDLGSVRSCSNRAWNRCTGETYVYVSRPVRCGHVDNPTVLSSCHLRGHSGGCSKDRGRSAWDLHVDELA